MTYDLIVIGGGVSGIAAAARAARAGKKTLLLEAGDRLGGCAHTWRPREDFWLELGAHTAYNSYGALLGLYPEASGYPDLLPRQKVGYYFFAAGKTLSPFKRLGLIEAALHLPFGLRADKAGQSVEAYYSRLLGGGNWRRLLAPAFAAVLSQSAAAYPADWLFRRKPRIKAAPRKFTHPQGLQGWLTDLAALWPMEVRLNAPATAIEADGEVVRVHTADGGAMAKRLLLATPPWTAGRLLADVVPGLAPRLAATAKAEIETLAVVLPAGKAKLPLLAGLIGGDDAFYSAVSRDYLPHPEWRGFSFHFKPGRLDAAGRRRRAAEVLGCGPDDFVHVLDKMNGLPALDVESVRLAAELERALAATPVRLAGNYLNGLSMGDAAQYSVDLVDGII